MTLDDLLVLYYALDEGSGTAISDTSGNDNHGLFDTPDWTGGTANFTNNSPHNFIKVPILSSNVYPPAALTSKVSFSVWTKAASYNGGWIDAIYVSESWQSNVLNFDFRFGNLGLNQHGQASGVAFGVSGTNWPTGVWTHTVVTYDTTNAEVKCYINGALFDTQSFPTTNLKVLLYYAGLGTDPHDATRNFDGPMKAFGIWKRILTAAEAKKLYNGGTPLPLSRFRQANPLVGGGLIR